MGVSVKIPLPFGACTNGRTEVTVEGNTVKKALQNLDEIHSGIIEKICDENGNLRRYVNLYLNERDIRSLDNLDTRVRSGDKISVVPAIAGG